MWKVFEAILGDDHHQPRPWRSLRRDAWAVLAPIRRLPWWVNDKSLYTVMRSPPTQRADPASRAKVLAYLDETGLSNDPALIEYVDERARVRRAAGTS